MNYICYIPVDRTIKRDIVMLIKPVSWIILSKSCNQNKPCEQNQSENGSQTLKKPENIWLVKTLK